MVDIETIKGIRTIEDGCYWRLSFKKDSNTLDMWIRKLRFKKYNIYVEDWIDGAPHTASYEKIPERNLFNKLDDILEYRYNYLFRLSFIPPEKFDDRKDLIFAKDFKRNYWYAHITNGPKALWVFIEEQKEGYLISHEIDINGWVYSTQDTLRMSQTSSLKFIDEEIIPAYNNLTGENISLL